MPSSPTRRIGLISDTHGLVRAGVHTALAGVELILHAGDVGGEDVLAELRLLAPVRAAAGNTDPPGAYDEAIELTIDGIRIHVSHGDELGSPTPARLASAYDSDVIVYGHTHKQLVTHLDGKLIVNPGAAGPKRFKLEPSVGVLIISAGTAEVEIIGIH